MNSVATWIDSFAKPIVWFLLIVFSVSSSLSCSKSSEPRPSGSKPSAAESLRATGHSFLIGNNNEECGYGLYSYFLLGSTPNDANRDRYLKAIVAFLRYIPGIKDLERSGIPQRVLNVTYVPVMDFVDPAEVLDRIREGNLDSSLMDDFAKWVLRNYNFSRARAFLNSIPGGSHLDGPYLVSTLKPLTGITSVTEHYLFQDMSSVPADIITPWIKEFIDQAAQEEFWEARNASQFTLKLRNAIAHLAAGTSEGNKAWPAAKKAIGTLIEWKKEDVAGSDRTRHKPVRQNK